MPDAKQQERQVVLESFNKGVQAMWVQSYVFLRLTCIADACTILLQEHTGPACAGHIVLFVAQHLFSSVRT